MKYLILMIAIFSASTGHCYGETRDASRTMALQFRLRAPSLKRGTRFCTYTITNAGWDIGTIVGFGPTIESARELATSVCRTAYTNYDVCQINHYEWRTYSGVDKWITYGLFDEKCTVIK